MQIRKLKVADAEAYVAARRAALIDAPLAFAASPEDDFVADVAAVRAQVARGAESAIYGALEGERLVGVIGVYRDRHLKASHKVHFWGLWVEPGLRRRGTGEALFAAALEHARRLPGATWVHLAVSSAAPGAKRLYEKAGFEVWGIEPEAMVVEGQSVDEFHMARRVGQ